MAIVQTDTLDAAKLRFLPTLLGLVDTDIGLHIIVGGVPGALLVVVDRPPPPSGVAVDGGTSSSIKSATIDGGSSSISGPGVLNGGASL